MPISDWSTVTLATYSDVTDRYARALELTDKTAVAEQQTEVTAYIARAKSYIGRKLDSSLQSKFVQNENFTATDDLKDYIANPEKLKEACVAYTLYLLFENNILNDQDFNYVMMDKFMKEFKSEYAMAVSILRFDQDRDGSISTAELQQGFGAGRLERA
ncbi:MAG TPA: hypothetical protein ENK32_07860 [Anaerolineae bacterium]|nr:hypothetical protein [Anaerolineae bacterium]